MAEKLKQVHVKGAGNDRKVVLWEKHPEHPNGEIFISNSGKDYTVAETAAVRRLMGEGQLIDGSIETPAPEPIPDAADFGFPTQPSVQPTTSRDAAPLRDATNEEERNAGLTTATEKDTAKVPDTNKKN